MDIFLRLQHPSREEATLVLSVIREEYIHSKLKTEIEEVLNTQEPRSFDFELNLSGENVLRLDFI